MNRILTILATLVMLAWAPLLSAQESPTDETAQDEVFSFGSQPGWQMLGGITAGGAFGSLGGGGFAGVELSISRLQRRAWWGAYLDASYDFAQRGVLTTLGPEIGYGPIGIDGGAALRIDTGDDAGRIDYGPQARFLFTVGLFGIYGRYVHLLDDQQHIGQVGLVFKLPLWAN